MWYNKSTGPNDGQHYVHRFYAVDRNGAEQVLMEV